MKKKFLFVVMLVAVIMTAVSLGGCSSQKMSLAFMPSTDGEVQYVEINIKKYEGGMLSDVLVGEKSLGAKLSYSEYGAKVLEVNGLKNIVEEGKYLMVYVNLEEFKNDYPHTPIVKDGVTYYQSKDSVDKLPVDKEAKYLFTLIQF